MNLNPISWIVDGVASVVSSYQTSKQARVEAKTAVQSKKVEYKLAKWSAKIDMLKSRAQHDADYDMQVLKNRRFTWLDEALGVSIIGMTLLAFVPGVAPYIKEGWAAVSQAPFWFQFAWYTLIASTLGGLTVLRVLLGMKGRASLPSTKDSTSLESDRDTPRTPQSSDHTDSQPRSEEAHTKSHRQDRTSSPGHEDENGPHKENESDRQVERVPGPPHGGGR